MSDSIHTLRCSKPIDEVAGDLEAAITNHGFGVMGRHNLKKAMANKGVAFDRECRVLEVCNPWQAKKVLDDDMAISTALPCRISLYQEGNETVIATFRPTVMLSPFDADGLEAVAEEIERTINAIMAEAAA